MYLKNLIKSWFHEETEQEKHQRALREMREALCVLMAPHYKPSIWEASDEDLLKWLELYPPGTGTKAQPVNYVNSYVEVKPPEEKGMVEAPLPSFTDLMEMFPISEQELEEIYNQCRKDAEKTYRVLQLMALTFMDNNSVLDDYEALYDRYKAKLK